MSRLLLALVLSPLLPIAAVGLLAWLDGSSVRAATLAAAMWCYLGALILGGPGFLLLRSFKWLRWWQLGTAGVGIGALAPLLQLSILLVSAIGGGASNEALRPLVPIVVVSAVIGGCMALTFWVLLRPNVGA